jgi:hypothetical protein
VRVRAGGAGAAAGAGAGAAAAGVAGAGAAPAGAAGAATAPPADASRQALLREMREKADKSKRGNRVALALKIVLGLCVIAIVTFGIIFCSVRWWAANDAARIQGTWVAAQVDAGAENTALTSGNIVIDSSSMQLSDTVAYTYTLDAGAKQLSFAFGNYAGSAHYRLSLDGNQLAICDGQYGWAASLAGDFSWTVNACLQHVFGQGELSPAGFNGGQDETLLQKAS